MATVYEGCDPADEGGAKRLTIKVLHAHLLAEPGSVEAFLDEARIVARLHHPCAARVVDFGRKVEGCYIATELVAGVPLTRFFDAAREYWNLCSRAEGFESMPVILKGASPDEPDEPAPLRPSDRRTPIPPSWSNEQGYTARCLRLVRDICDGLHAAHELRDDDGKPLGVVLGELSPEAIFIRSDGSIQLDGFSFPRPETAAQDAATGVFPARFAYMAPEQLQGAPPDPRTNVWTLGVILWELLTRQRLFPATSPMETAMAIVDAKITPATDANPALPTAIDALLSRALDRNPRTRYATPLHLGQAIDVFCQQHGRFAQRSEIAAWMRELFPEAVESSDAAGDDDARPWSDPVAFDSAGPQLAPAPNRPKAFVSIRSGDPGGDDERAASVPEKRVDAPRPGSSLRSPALRRMLSLATRVGVLALVAWSAHRLIVKIWPSLGSAGETARQQPTAASPSPRAPEATPLPAAVPSSVGPPSTFVASGTVIITSRGAPADIYCEGELVGRTPATLSLPVGRHALDLRRDNRDPPFHLMVQVQPETPAIVSMPED